MWRTPAPLPTGSGCATAFSIFEGFREQVMLPFCEAYRRARTPNPCIECNRRMKFDALFRRAEELGCEKDRHRPLCAHRPCGERYILQKGSRRDEGPELCALCHDAAGACTHVLPAGGHAQERDARHRRGAGLWQRAQKGQPGHLLCPDGDYAAAIGRLTGEKSVPGAFVSTDGRVLGEHKGIIHYTVGQRRGLGIPHGERLYASAGSIRRETRSSSAKRRTCTGAKRR